MTHILFLCTGNTCRRPMARCLAQEIIARQGLWVTCDSGGLHAAPGAPATPGAQAAMAARGLSLKEHRAKEVSAAMAKKADVVLCMTPAHVREFARRFPEDAHKARALSPPVPDPFGGDAALYLRTAEQLAALLPPLLKEVSVKKAGDA